MNRVFTIRWDHTLPLRIGEGYCLSLEDFQDIFQHRKLILWQWDGLYFLVPREVVQNIALVLDQLKKSEDNLNSTPTPLVKTYQCIPIPSETAKILLEL